MGVLGVGRIGRLHADLLKGGIAGATLSVVADAAPGVADLAAEELGVDSAADIDEVLSSPDVDAVAICTSTSSHADLVARAARAGKAIFCEKPISLDLGAVDAALADVSAAGVPFMVGFNRRFDPSHRAVSQAARSGALGDLHLVRITSRDPAPPPATYAARSGGLFVDMTIHDFDMARFVVGSEVVQVVSFGSARVDPRLAESGDIDTAVTVLTHADGTLTTIDNSRRAVYGFDQRVEAFGSRGMARSENSPRHAASLHTAEGATSARPPVFFLDRYRESFRLELEAFALYCRSGGESPVSGSDGRSAIVVAMAATASLHEARAVAVDA